MKRALFTVTIGLALIATLILAPSLFALDGENAPEFYGAFTAALVAAAALIFGAYYQDHLARLKDEKARTEERTAESIELCFWLDHCDSELEFILKVLTRMKERLSNSGRKIDMPLDQFREVISSHFFDGLLQRVRAASRLNPEIAAFVTSEIYRTYTTVDRIFRLRGASEDFRPTLEDLEKYIFVLSRRRAKLQTAARLIEAQLVENGALPKYVEAD